MIGKTYGIYSKSPKTPPTPPYGRALARGGGRVKELFWGRTFGVPAFFDLDLLFTLLEISLWISRRDTRSQIWNPRAIAENFGVQNLR